MTRKLPAEQRAADERHMTRCLELARRFEGRTAPNPIARKSTVENVDAAREKAGDAPPADPANERAG